MNKKLSDNLIIALFISCILPILHGFESPICLLSWKDIGLEDGSIAQILKLLLSKRQQRLGHELTSRLRSRPLAVENGLESSLECVNALE